MKKAFKPILLQLNSFEDLELVAVKCKINKEEFIFACFYKPSVQNTEILEKLDLALSDLCSFGKPLVLMGDFNLPDVKWDDIAPFAPSVCKQDEFLRVLSENGLIQTVLEPTRNGKILDLVFTNEHNLIKDVTVCAPMSDSCDHNTVTFKLNLAPKNNPVTRHNSFVV